MQEIKIDQESAELEFDNFCEEWDIEIDPDRLDDEDTKTLEELKHVIVRSIMQGRIEFNEEDSTLSVTLKKPVGSLTVLKFKEPDGGMYAAGDKYKAEHAGARANATIGYLCGQPASVINRLKNADTKVCQALLRLFMHQ